MAVARLIKVPYFCVFLQWEYSFALSLKPQQGPNLYPEDPTTSSVKIHSTERKSFCSLLRSEKMTEESEGHHTFVHHLSCDIRIRCKTPSSTVLLQLWLVCFECVAQRKCQITHGLQIFPEMHAECCNQSWFYLFFQIIHRRARQSQLYIHTYICLFIFIYS